MPQDKENAVVNQVTIPEGDPDRFQKALRPIRVMGSGMQTTEIRNSFHSLTIEEIEKTGGLVVTKEYSA